MSRFTPGDTAYRNGRPVTIAAVDRNGRYSIFYTDEAGGVEHDVYGRVLSTREGK